MPSARTLPNIALCGTPATGKSTLCTALAAALPGLRYINVSAEAEARGCRGEFDAQLQTWEVDEAKLARSLRGELARGGCLVEWIHADFLVPEEGEGEDEDGEGNGEGEGDEDEDDEDDDAEEEEDDMVDLVIQMRADTTALYDRYKERGYSDAKIQENLDCEIMDEIGSENRDVFDESKCVVLNGLQGEGAENVSRVLAWVEAWKKNNNEGEK